MHNIGLVLRPMLSNDICAQWNSERININRDINIEGDIKPMDGCDRAQSLELTCVSG